MARNNPNPKRPINQAGSSELVDFSADADVIKVYQVNDADKNGTIDNTEVKLVDTFNSSVALEDANIA